MKINFLDYKKSFDKDGYFICKNVFNKDFIHQLINEINNSKNSIKYFDNFKKLRRIEKLYDKGNNLKYLNKKISTLLNNVFDVEFLIFKDKFNTKPPGGDGFFAHYDGIFHFINPNNEKKNGWYEYGDFFVNALVALDECNKENGAFEIANIHRGNLDQLIEKTKKDGTPALTKETEIKTSFKLINLNVGDMVVFSNTCPHRSKNNDSNKSRRIIYYTYSLSKNGSKYKKYFDDKENSKNTSKALDAN